MNSEELNCPICCQTYTLQNPPRLLTTCGHTFCHKCIKTLISKKSNTLFKVKCPIDKKIVQIQKPNAGLFPKNIILLEYLNKVKQKSKESIDEKNQFLNLYNSPLESKFHQTTQNSLKIKQSKQIIQANKEVCQTHSKPLQIFCLEDKLKICTDCAIFGQHKNHKLKNLLHLTQQQKQSIDKIKYIIDKKQKIEENISSRQLQNEVLDLLMNKNKLIREQINQIFFKIRKTIDSIEQTLQQQLQEKTMQVAHKVKQLLQIDHNINLQFKQWETKASKAVYAMQKAQQSNCHDQIIENVFYQSEIQGGLFLLNTIQSQQSKLMTAIEEQISAFKLEKSNTVSNIHKIRQICQISIINYTSANKVKQSKVGKLQKSLGKFDKQNKLQIEKLKKSLNQSFQEQSLLQSDSPFDHTNSSILNTSKSCNHLNFHSVITKGSQRNQQIKNFDKKKHSKIISNQNVKAQSKLRSTSINLNSSRSSANIRSSRIIKGSQKRIQLGLKYQNMIEKLKKDQIEILDLTGADIGDQNIQMVTDLLAKSKNVKSVKLLRNKLSDRSIDAVLLGCKTVEKINLAQNKFTEDILLKILTSIKNKQNNLKCVHLGQNRIFQRKNKEIVQEFKKLQVGLIL